MNIDAEPGVKGQKSDSQRIRSRLNDPSMRSQLISGPSEFKEGVIFCKANKVEFIILIDEKSETQKALGSYGSRTCSPGCVTDIGPGNSSI